MISCGKHVDLASVRIKGPLQGDIEALFLGPRSVIGEIEAFLDQGVDIDRPVLAGAFARMQQHVLDDRVGALAVLHHLFEIALQHVGQLVEFLSYACRRQAATGLSSIAQFIDQFGRERREIVDEIERVLDLVRDAGGELAERGELLGLDKAILCGAQFFQRHRQFARAGFHAFKQARILNREHRLCRERLKQINGVFREFAGLLAPDDECANGSVGTQQRHDQQGAEPGADDDIEDGWIGIVLNVRNLDRDASAVPLRRPPCRRCGYDDP